MPWPTRVLLVAAVVAAFVGRRSLAREPNDAELAALIDRHVEARLDAERIRPAELADDAEFLRRVYLDLHGSVPTTEQAARFLNDSAPTRRAALIDSLLASPRYGEYLADVWQGYLVSPLADDYRVRAGRFRKWLADRFNTQAWDRIASELLTATGKLDQNPAVIYLIEGRLPRTVPDLTDLTSRDLLGVRLSCAQCHDHPFVPWTRQDYWGMAAFFAQVQTPGRPKLVYQVGVKDYPETTLASLKNEAPDGFLPLPPTFLGGGELPSGRKSTDREALSAWVTAPDNRYFARAMVNRTWWRLFGRGIVNPVDDMHAANSPSHPELLDLLARRFAESGFDLKFLTRAIVLSRTYQRTSRPGDDPEKQAALFGRMSVKVFSAGQLYDSLVTIFGPPSKAPGVDSRSDARAEFTQFFAEDGDPDPTAYRRGIPHLLRQMNSGQFAGRNLATLAARLAAPLKAGAPRSPDDIAADLFLAILSRHPTADERRLVRDHLAASDSAEAACKELTWSLMMTSEFSLNH
jgi:hypothetical protein